MSKLSKFNLILGILIVIGIIALAILIVNKRQKITKPPTSEQPTKTASRSATITNTQDKELLKTLEALNTFPEKPCPTPEGRYHTVKFVYSNPGIQNGKTVYYIRFAGSPQNLTTTMSPMVEKRISLLVQGQSFTAYYYTIDKNAPTNKPSVNTTIWCFTTP